LPLPLPGDAGFAGLFERRVGLEFGLPLTADEGFFEDGEDIVVVVEGVRSERVFHFRVEAERTRLMDVDVVFV